MKPKKIIVFAPHPDDDLIGCGGSIVRHIIEGATVLTVYLTSGQTGEQKIREREAKNAAKITGVKPLIFLKQPVGYLKFSNNILKKVRQIIIKEKPNVIYIPHGNEADLDHRITYQIVNEAIRRASWLGFENSEDIWATPLVLTYEVWTPLQNYNYVEDITNTIDEKVKALEEHKSQLRYKNYAEEVQFLQQQQRKAPILQE